jgi:tRNA (guanine37-N1)-methyltransferase
VVYLSPRGRRFDQAMARRFAQCDGITLLCGRFEGVDERVLEHFGIEEVSALGDFVLTGGEIAAQALIDATVRLIPRVLGNQASTEEESFSEGLAGISAVHETRRLGGPCDTRGSSVGPSRNIAPGGRPMAERLTKERRPDLWRAYCAAHGRDPDEDQEL